MSSDLQICLLSQTQDMHLVTLQNQDPESFKSEVNPNKADGESLMQCLCSDLVWFGFCFPTTPVANPGLTLLSLLPHAGVIGMGYCDGWCGQFDRI